MIDLKFDLPIGKSNTPLELVDFSAKIIEIYTNCIAKGYSADASVMLASDLIKDLFPNVGLTFTQVVKKKTNLTINECIELMGRLELPEPHIVALADWLAYKYKKRQYYQEQGIKALCKVWGKVSIDTLRASITHCTSSGYDGLFESKVQVKSKQVTQALNQEPI
jgi:hypothetical protein